MSASQVLEQIHKLSFEEQCEILEQLRVELEPGLTAEEITELDRRAERALAHPELCRPLDDVVADIEKRFRAKG